MTKQGNKRTSSSLGWYLAGIFLLLLAGAGFFGGNWILGAFLVVLGGIFLLYPGRKKRKAVASEKTGQEEKQKNTVKKEGRIPIKKLPVSRDREKLWKGSRKKKILC